MIGDEGQIPALLYYSAFGVALILVIVFGLFSATHFKLFSREERNRLSKHERRLLRLPDVWLSSSMWLLYINNAVMALAIVCSLIVIVIAAYDNAERSVVSIIVFTLIGLTCSFLANYTNGKEKSIAYRNAFMVMNPICEQYINRYLSVDCVSERTRESDFQRLVEAREAAETIIADAHNPYQAHGLERRMYLEPIQDYSDNR